MGLLFAKVPAALLLLSVAIPALHLHGEINLYVRGVSSVAQVRISERLEGLSCSEHRGMLWVRSASDPGNLGSAAFVTAGSIWKKACKLPTAERTLPQQSRVSVGLLKV